MVTQKKQIVKKEIRANSRIEAIDQITRWVNGLDYGHYFHLIIKGVTGDESEIGIVEQNEIKQGVSQVCIGNGNIQIAGQSATIQTKKVKYKGWLTSVLVTTLLLTRLLHICIRNNRLKNNSLKN